MTLKFRILSFIVPIFVGIAIFLGILKYKTEQREALWGIKEYVSSLGEAIYQFIPFSQVKSYFDDPANSSVKNIDAIVEWNPSFKALWLIKVDDPNNRVLVSGSNVGGKLNPTSLAAFSFDYKNDDLVLITRVSKDPEINWGLLIDVSEDKQDLKNNLIESFVFGVIILLLGVSISLFISGILRRNFFYLNKSAKKVILGNYKKKVSTKSNVQEIIDLANTFDTMRNVLSDFLERIQRRSVDYQISSKSLRLPTKNYNSIIWKNKRMETHGLTISLEFVNMSDFLFNRNFGGIFFNKKNTFAFVGKIHLKKNKGEFSRNVHTSLAKILFENGLQSNLSVEDAFIPLKNLYDLESFFCLEIFSKQNIKLYQLKDNDIKVSKVDFSNTKAINVHTFDSKVGELLNEAIHQVNDPSTFPVRLFVEHISNEPGNLLLLS